MFRVLFVCTGNVCRSPMAERLLAARMTEALDPGDADQFAVASAGTMDLGGVDMDPKAAAAVAELGADPEDHCSMVLTAEAVADADLVLGMTREHRGAAIRLVPVASRRAFTLREYVRLCRHADLTRLPDGSPVERAAALVDLARGQRGLCPPADPADDDVEDPLGMLRQVFEHTARRLDDDLRYLVACWAGTDVHRTVSSA